MSVSHSIDGAASDSRSRVFVSSVIDGFAEFRQAARDAIIAASGEPVLVEDFPSIASSSRNVCLDAIDTCDLLVCIIGQRGGWTAPSGKLVVQEEIEHARAKKLPILGFVQDTEFDPDAARLVRQLSDYVDGGFRRKFVTADDLRQEIKRSIHPLMHETSPSRIADHFRDYFTKPYMMQGVTTLRFVLTPQRVGELIDPVRLSSETFLRSIYEIGHSADAPLLSYARSKVSGLDGDDLVLLQTERGGNQNGEEQVRLQVSSSGELVIDANVTGRVKRGSTYGMMDSMVVALEDIENVLASCFGFAAAFYNEFDEFKRHQHFLYNVGLSGLDYRKLERNPQQRNTFAMSMRERGTIMAFEAPRTLARADFGAPSPEIERVVEMLKRRSGD